MKGVSVCAGLGLLALLSLGAAGCASRDAAPPAVGTATLTSAAIAGESSLPAAPFEDEAEEPAAPVVKTWGAGVPADAKTASP